ncbi:MAG: pilus assembly protein TadG-related protein [Candidatus Omnitrophica bacterium]|nr:pilus assembly protein TadG-related protein [Candidatus Omnitrophota bacterium]
MYIKFATNKTKYESGQIFPFLIAIICIVIIMAMITVNLGQIALFRTDASNASDAGALAGASVMSGQLLSYGITSDMMCAQNLVKCAAIVVAFLTMQFGTAIPVAIAIVVTMLSSNVTALMKAYTDSQMAWTNARKTAMQYAFSNAPVDEPRITYEDFLDCLVGGCRNGSRAAPTTDNYNAYLYTDSPNVGLRNAARQYARNGFAKFMDNSNDGWWIDESFGSVEAGPDAPVPSPLVVNGYGWTWSPPLPSTTQGRYINSFEDSGFTPAQCASNYCWRNYQNFIEVQVKSRLMYAFELVGLPGQDALGWAVFAYVAATKYPVWLAVFAWTGPLAPIIAALLSAAEGMLAKILIDSVKFGIDFSNPDEMIEGSPVEVTVARYKAESNVGLWNFRYATNPLMPIRAKAQGHVFREMGNETIAPAFFNLGALWNLILFIISFGTLNDWDDIFNTQKHLFETKLRAVQ